MNTSVWLARLARRAIEDYLAVEPGEVVLLLSDSGTSEAIPHALASAVSAVGADPIHVQILPRSASGVELPEAILAAVEAADVVISAASRSPYHSSLKVRAQNARTRGVLNSPPHESGWTAGAMRADFNDLRPVADRLRAILDAGETARVTSPLGTDITMSIAGRGGVGWLVGIAREPGQTVAWPGGEVSLPPVEGTANGRVVVDVAMTDLGAVRTPIEWTVRDGLCVGIEGGPEAARLTELIAGIRDATNIGELGIGINPLARLVADITEAKKRAGTAHIALGDSANGYGGEVSCDLHLDGLITNATIEIDGSLIVEAGELKF